MKIEEMRKCVQHLTTERGDQWLWFMGSFCPQTLPVHMAGWQVVCPVIASVPGICALSWLKASSGGCMPTRLEKKHPTQQTAARQCCEHLHWPVEAMKMPSSCRALRCDMDQFRANVNLVLKLFLSYCC